MPQQRAEKPSRIEQYVKEEDGNIKVNWKKLYKNKWAKDEESEDWCETLHYLKDIGVLVPSHRKNGFFLFAEGLDVSPTATLVTYHFKREEDAKEYKDAEFKNAMYEVRIVKKLSS